LNGGGVSPEAPTVLGKMQYRRKTPERADRLNRRFENRGTVLPKPGFSTDSAVCARWRRVEVVVNLFKVKSGAIKSALKAHSTASKIITAGLIGSLLLLFAPSSTESAAANGDTRTIYLYHAHTGESIDATYLVDGHYDPEVLKKLNWFLRDWRRNEETNMDPRLFDAVWEAYRGAGATQRITVLCGYRSPETNAMLRRRSRAVAEHSQHILGKAMDTTMHGMSMERVRESAARLQMGGVGYYGDTNFVHIDVGGVRMWPRMTYAQLMRLFPDGKTVHIASDGRTLPGYDEARAELAANGTAVASLPPSQHSGIGAFFAWLFGKGNSGDDEDNASTEQQQPPAPAPTQVAAAQAPAAPPAEAMQADATTGSIPDRSSAAAAPDTETAAIDMPLPPQRPDDLVAAADVPLPPERPTFQLTALLTPEAAPAAKAPVVVADAETAPADLPGIITQGPNDGRPREGLSRMYGVPALVLAYAPVAQMEGLRRAAHHPEAIAPMPAETVTIAPARLDGSNFGSLTSGTEFAELPSATVFGPTAIGLRSAARVESATLFAKPSADYTERFQRASATLPAHRFAMALAPALRQDDAAISGE
jgi:uncharacterized protein YcbK (DUF882 family)